MLTSFWHDVWLLKTPLKIVFPHLFDICSNPTVKVADCYNSEWEMDFRRIFGDLELVKWANIQYVLHNVQLNQEEDVVSWTLSPNKMFSTRSLYPSLIFGGVSSKLTSKVWKCNLPLKIRIFFDNSFRIKYNLNTNLRKDTGKKASAALFVISRNC